MAAGMAMSDRLWIVMVGALVALVPAAADAARQKTGKAAKGKPAEAKAGLVAFTDSRGCKLWSSESAAKRMKEIASQGAVTWQGVCKSGFISGTGVLREEGQSVIGGRTKKFAHFLSGTANKGVRTGQWKRESSKVQRQPEFHVGHCHFGVRAWLCGRRAEAGRRDLLEPIQRKFQHPYSHPCIERAVSGGAGTGHPVC
ncbi:MAG: hypothetical protein IPI44_23980 [Sulfuritalea sp.]|nr:hypothetical protein [Sulfuritalea sp.]